ncbi:aminopeptidase [Candidatus Nomurabacteria bacterium]|uniref:Aminopeptidase n=1 Tax=candidate division WWE3 bacterium TaxID=2053526 RepID=A0A955IWI4_UNCKA|nr:aminopeptidase [candidate division WWE3 bacterium]MCB9824058.1 aminopeptidase [Candidatus Nomurabacteria bacterium]MCB9826971.1 aminopeptidase [Candidatus Nomurabacteria bacterium]MCB9827999.1 aminopeptidase [Candidatus Nomurabacteria bacterium]HXK52848.1 aminopeptidase [bacterium]
MEIINKLQRGSFTAINSCLRVKQEDRVLIVTDLETKEVGESLYSEAKKVCKNVKIVVIEDYTNRPAKSFPDKLKHEIDEFKPNISIYAAQGYEGELGAFRRPLIDYFKQKYNCKHAHMISITKQLMEDGMNQDLEKVYDLTNKLLRIVEQAERIHVSDPHGTNITFYFDSKLKWIPDDGRIEPGHMQNLPCGEVYTSPKTGNGRFVAWVLGDNFASQGVLKSPLTVEIENGIIASTSCDDTELLENFNNYVNEHEFGNRVGEFAIGTLLGLTGFVGNLLQDEKFPGVHIAFGYPYPHETGADWTCPSHLDIIAKDTTVTLWLKSGEEEKTIMVDGKFIPELL